MPPLIVDGVARFVMFGTNGRPWVNILDMHIDTAAIGGDREAACRDQAEIINQEWPSRVNFTLSATWQYQGCRWIDLDTLDGSTGETAETSGALVLPVAGLATGQGCPPNVAILIKKLTGGSRNTRDGRLYLAGQAEVNQDHQLVTSGTITTLNTNLAAAKSAIEQEGKVPIGGGEQYDSKICVVHQHPDGSTSRTDITGLQAVAQVATQRRRLRP